MRLTYLKRFFKPKYRPVWITGTIVHTDFPPVLYGMATDIVKRLSIDEKRTAWIEEA